MTHTGSWRFCSPQDSKREPRRGNLPEERKASFLESVCARICCCSMIFLRACRRATICITISPALSMARATLTMPPRTVDRTVDHQGLATPLPVAFPVGVNCSNMSAGHVVFI
jgi:hypothetical protein